ncbi:MAG: hypothetical protein ABIT08_00965 [Bacteroidia bacterium]
MTYIYINFKIKYMPDKIERKYRMEDELMLSRAEVQKEALRADLALFTAKFPWITTPYVDSYETDISTADALPLDGSVMSDITVLTDDVNSTVIEGREALQQLFRYAKITYPNNEVKERSFGQNDMDKARNDQEKMENLLERANLQANKTPFKSELIAMGYLQPQMDNLLTIADNIHTKNLVQNSGINNRPVTTQQRIMVYNIVYVRANTVYQCAQEVFVGDPAKIQQYRVYPPSTPDTTTANVHVVNPSAEPMENLLVRILALPEHTTDIAGMAGPFDLGSTPPDFVDVIVSGAGITPSPQTFNKAVTDGVVNTFEITVLV